MATLHRLYRVPQCPVRILGIGNSLLTLSLALSRPRLRSLRLKSALKLRLRLTLSLTQNSSTCPRLPMPLSLFRRNLFKRLKIGSEWVETIRHLNNLSSSLNNNQLNPRQKMILIITLTCIQSIIIRSTTRTTTGLSHPIQNLPVIRPRRNLRKIQS